jgi:hypothetical protein
MIYMEYFTAGSRSITHFAQQRRWSVPGDSLRPEARIARSRGPVRVTQSLKGYKIVKLVRV